jgi:hypothetical protein
MSGCRSMVYISGGNIYASADTKLPSGKMMSTEIFGRDQYLQ